MAPRNRTGQSGWTPSPVPGLDPGAVEVLQRAGGVVVDARPRRTFAAGHLPGSVNIGLDEDFATYLGWLFPLDTRFALVLEEGQDATDASRAAARVGIETIVGWLQGGVAAWARSGRALRRYPVISFDELSSRLQAGAARVLDVRQTAEWEAGHIPGARHVHVPDLPARLGELGDGATIHVHCAKGYRAALAASLLDAAGIPVVAVDGAFEDWVAGGHPVSLAGEE
ncbi:MAG TPA: rhodanese-like domain-containing protein, partial [Candidatus Dormibacteraeota bacterium]|nr:rhodanese-like domain-containing protein [Candidatus Dormibacteraeota bacterium]